MASIAETLAALDAAIAGYVANGCVKSYTADGVTVTRESFKDQLAARAALRAELAASKMGRRTLADLRGTGS